MADQVDHTVVMTTTTMMMIMVVEVAIDKELFYIYLKFHLKIIKLIIQVHKLFKKVEMKLF